MRVSAYMDPWGATAPMDWWTLVNRCRALENMAYVVAANQGASCAHYPPFSWPGGSMVVDFDGRILAQARPGPGERIVVGARRRRRAAARARDAPRPSHARAPAHRGVPGLRDARLSARGRTAHSRSRRTTPASTRPRRGSRGSIPAAWARGAAVRKERRDRASLWRCVRAERGRRAGAAFVRATRTVSGRAVPQAAAATAPALRGLGDAQQRRPDGHLPLRRTAGHVLRAPRGRRRRRRSLRLDRDRHAGPARHAVSCAPQALRDRRRSRCSGPTSRSPTPAATSGRSRCARTARRCRACSPGSRAAPRSRLPRASRLPGGKRPMARLSGEVQLRRVVPGATGAAAAAQPPGAVGRSRQAGRQRREVVGANIVGLGLLYGRQQARQGQQLHGQRHLLAARLRRRHARRTLLLREQRALGGAVRDHRPALRSERPATAHSVPCQAALSCNSGVCEDRDGRCPY